MGPEILSLDSQPREIPRAPTESVRALLESEINKVINGDQEEYTVLVGRREYPSGREVIFHQLPRKIEIGGVERVVDTKGVDAAFWQIIGERLGVDFPLVMECLEDEWDEKIDEGYNHTVFEWQFPTTIDNILVVFRKHVASIGEMGWEWAVRNTHPKGLGTRIKEGVRKRFARFPVIIFPY